MVLRNRYTGEIGDKEHFEKQHIEDCIRFAGHPQISVASEEEYLMSCEVLIGDLKG